MPLATTWSGARQIWTWVVERATLLFNTFCRNVAKQVARFCCPFYRRFSVLNLLHVNIIRRNDTLRIRLTRYGDKWLHIKTRFWQIWHSTFSNTTTLKKTVDISKHQLNQNRWSLDNGHLGIRNSLQWCAWGTTKNSFPVRHSPCQKQPSLRPCSNESGHFWNPIGAYIFQRPFLRGLFLKGLIFGGAYLRREICVSKSIGLAL